MGIEKALFGMLFAAAVAVPADANAQTWVQGTYIDAQYGTSGTWNNYTAGRGLQISDGVTTRDVSYPGSPWNQITWAYTVGTTNYTGSLNTDSVTGTTLSQTNYTDGSSNAVRSVYTDSFVKVTKTELWHDADKTMTIAIDVQNISSSTVSNFRYIFGLDADQDSSSTTSTLNDSLNNYCGDSKLDVATSAGPSSGWTVLFGVCTCSQETGHANWGTTADEVLTDNANASADVTMHMRDTLGSIAAGSTARSRFIVAWDTAAATVQSNWTTGWSDYYTWYYDSDGDGYGGTSSTTYSACSHPSTNYVAVGGDCNDSSSSANPGGTEVCNSVDDDCDGVADDGLTTYTYYRDLDGDGYGNSGSGTTVTCATSAPSGYSTYSTDCNDGNSGIKPGAAEVCDGVDQDCDGTADDGLTTYTYYRDLDSDGYGRSASGTTTTCATTPPSGYSTYSTDCNDSDNAVYPGRTEICNSKDDDCDGSTDEGVTTTYYVDSDGDTYGTSSTTQACSLPSGYATRSGDCDDTKIGVNPGATEVCNSIDDDCDSSTDEGVTTTYYVDSDGDTYGTSVTTQACSLPSGYATRSGDCDDTRNTVYPSATETCNERDDDCDGTKDEGVETTFYADSDSDTYGDATSTKDACTAPTGYVSDSSDCDDTRDTIYPGASETCNGFDDDCDSTTDEGVQTTFYADSDSDGYGDESDTKDDCFAPTGYVADSTDCDDTDGTIYPTATETPYDAIDQDCDGADLTDVDGDGYDADVVDGGDDCNDEDDSIHPGATETADGVDEDCNDIVDDGTTAYDDDADGYSEDGGDCDDTDFSISPDAVEVCDGFDQDCDEIVDEGTECYDDDGDGYDESQGDCDDANVDRSPGVSEVLENGIDDDCDGIVDEGGINDPDEDGYSEAGGDCDPDDGTVYPGAPELEDGKDNDCDDLIDEGTNAYDDDGDGYTENDGDCNDADDAIGPDADETADGVDEDCDGLVDEGTDAYDDDGDGYTEDGGDCDDADDSVAPDAEELPNGVDDDCDGETDEGLDDVDQDGYGEADGDCDDTNELVYPAAYEICDDLDNDCNGDVDDNSVCDDGKGGCGCATGGVAGALPLWLAGLALVRRRRNAHR